MGYQIFATGYGQIAESVRIEDEGAVGPPPGRSVTTDDNLFERIPWLEVCMRLRAMAGWLTHDQPDVFDAVSADDLVSETVLAFLRSPNALGWMPARGKLETFLCAVLKNRFIDHLRRHRRYGGPLEDGDLFAM